MSTRPASGDLYPIVLPSETRTREFDAKLLLAGMLAERGHPVYVGSRIAIHNRIQTLPRGLYLGKDVRRSSRKVFEIMARRGFAMACWDEEALVVANAKTYQEKRVDPPTLAHVAAFFAAGPQGRRLIETAPGYPGTPIHETGNPRLDLLSPRCQAYFQDEVDALRARFGDFVLINSNFGALNHFMPELAARRDASGAFVNLSSGSQDWWDYRLRVFESFKALLPALAAALPERTIVLRPHPSENHGLWRDLSAGHPNVAVLHEGHVYPWLLASKVAIHNGCTTGLESYLMGHAVIAYEAVTSDRFPEQLPNRVSTKVESFDALVAAVRGLFAGTPLAGPGAGADAAAAEVVGARDGVLASERIDAVIAADGAGWIPPLPSVATRLAGWIDGMARWAGKAVNAYRPGHKNNRAYAQHRFPDMDEAEAQARLARMARLMGRFEGLTIRRVGPNIFRLDRA
jgi:surface carbohydrate biosynthesis protein